MATLPPSPTIPTSASSAARSATSSAPMAARSCSGGSNISAPPRSTAHRGVAGADAIDPGLDALSLDETLDFVRGFMLFSMLANLAEDRQGVAAEQGADLAAALARLDERGDRARRGDRAARPCADRPGAHRAPDRGAAQEHDRPPQPHRRADARCKRSRAATRPPEGDLVDEAILRQIALLWQTRVLRRERLVRRRRGRDRARPICATSSCRCCPRSTRAGTARWASAPPSFLRAGQLDRRRPRRQSRSSPPIRCGIALARGVARRCSAIISTRSTRSAPNCRSRPSIAPVDAGGRRAGRGQRRRRRRAAATSPIAARSRASMRGSPRRIATLTGKPAPRPGRARRRALCRSRRSSAPISSRSRAALAARATGRWRAAARSAG